MAQRESGLQAALPADLKYANRIQVINAFLDGKPSSVNDVSAATGLSRQTVMKCVQFFLRQGLLASVGKGDSTPTGGKRPTLYVLPDNRYFLCVALWPQELRLSLHTLSGTQIDHSELIAFLPRSHKAAMDNVGMLADSLLFRNGVSKADVLGVSVSTAGTVDYRTGHLKYSSQTPAWGSDVPLLEELRPHFLPSTLMLLENAGKMTARPLLLEPELRSKRVLTVFSCWGLSSCLIEKGRILSGRNSLIGEIGHMTIDPSDPQRCGCGGRGCLERLVSPERIQQTVAEIADQYPESPLVPMGDRLTVPDLFEASRKGDALAQALSCRLAGIFAAALRNISLVFDPELVVFQGDFSAADRIFRDRLMSELKGFQYYPAAGPFQVRCDRRTLAEMDTQGSYLALLHHFFSNDDLFLDSDTEEKDEAQPG